MNKVRDSHSPLRRALLVDDERLAHKRLRSLLAAHPEVTVVGEAYDLESARKLVREQKPDLVFLDIELSPGDGFELLSDLPAETNVIFVTAHDGFAVRAFEINALDYLLKPVLPARLATSLERLRQAGTPAGQPSSPAPRMELHEQLLLRDGRTWHRVPIHSVTAVLGEGCYTRLLLTEGNSILTLKTLAHWSEVLPENAFVRLSRSMIVNLTLIRHCRFITRDHSEILLEGRERPLRLGRVASRKLRRHWREQEREQP